MVQKVQAHRAVDTVQCPCSDFLPYYNTW